MHVITMKQGGAIGPFDTWKQAVDFYQAWPQGMQKNVVRVTELITPTSVHHDCTDEEALRKAMW